MWGFFCISISNWYVGHLHRGHLASFCQRKCWGPWNFGLIQQVFALACWRLEAHIHVNVTGTWVLLQTYCVFSCKEHRINLEALAPSQVWSVHSVRNIFFHFFQVSCSQESFGSSWVSPSDIPASSTTSFFLASQVPWARCVSSICCCILLRLLTQCLTNPRCALIPVVWD